MSRLDPYELDHYEFDLAAFKRSRCKSVACHLFDDRPMGEKILLGLYLRWEPGLQNAALPSVAIRYLKRHRLRSLVDLLFGGLGKFPHALFLYEILARPFLARLSGARATGIDINYRDCVGPVHTHMLNGRTARA